MPLPVFSQARRPAEPQVVDGIAAVVSLPDPTGKVQATTDVITYSQVRQLVAPREKLLRQQLTGDALVKAVKEAREAALKDLIDRQLIIQAFKKEQFQIPDHFIDQRMQEIIQENFEATGILLSSNAGSAELHHRRVQKDGDRTHDRSGDAKQERQKTDHRFADQDR